MQPRGAKRLHGWPWSGPPPAPRARPPVTSSSRRRPAPPNSLENGSGNGGRSRRSHDPEPGAHVRGVDQPPPPVDRNPPHLGERIVAEDARPGTRGAREPTDSHRVRRIRDVERNDTVRIPR